MRLVVALSLLLLATADAGAGQGFGFNNGCGNASFGASGFVSSFCNGGNVVIVTTVITNDAGTLTLTDDAGTTSLTAQ